MKRTVSWTSILILSILPILAQPVDRGGRSNGLDSYKPTIKDMILLPIVSDARVSPDSSFVAYLVGRLDLGQNDVAVRCFVYDITTGTHRSLIRRGRVSSVRWMSDGTLALLEMTEKNGFQIIVYEDPMGDGYQVTEHPGGIERFEPFGDDGFLFVADHPSQEQAARRLKYGDFIRVEKDDPSSGLFYASLSRAKGSRESPGTPGAPLRPVALCLNPLLPCALKINDIVIPRAGDFVLLNCQERDGAYFENDTRHFLLRFDPDDLSAKERTPNSPQGDCFELALPKGARIQAVSPEGERILVLEKEGELKSFNQSDLGIYSLGPLRKNPALPIKASRTAVITKRLDQEPLQSYWVKAGIFVRFWQESSQRIAKIADTGEFQVLDLKATFPANRFFVNERGVISYPGSTAASLKDIFLARPDSEETYSVTRVTRYGEECPRWDFGTVESIRWKSRDGTEIEGVLHKPSDFDPGRKYPLIFLIHGGPASSAPLALFDPGTAHTYPTVQLINRHILILEPNYRGSLGRGRDFQKLNVDNLGIGDQWDIESAIDDLAAKGFIDTARVGAMGWSQGGYISSFLAMHSDRFKAVSAGAALSSWRVYYNGSDNRNDYPLTGDPFRDLALYERTAPIGGIQNARTPVMFQHGQNDQRVPLVSALEMFRALKQRGVVTELFVYPGRSHGWLSPKECYALMVQNYRWFMHFLCGEPLDFQRDDQGRGLPDKVNGR